MSKQNPFRSQDQSAEPRLLPVNREEPLYVDLVRGELAESRHRVHAAVARADGRLLRHWGATNLEFFPRSSIKLLQATSFVAPGYDRLFGLGAAELAIACGSHFGEEEHVRVVAHWLERLELDSRDLACGTHEPWGPAAFRALARKGEAPCTLHNNCSGKHTGFLTACLAHGWPTADYIHYDHPLQAAVREQLEPFFDVNFSEAPWGVDGCGIPTYAVTLRGLAMAMARTADPRGLSADLQGAVATLTRAIEAHPRLIGGEDSFSSLVPPETHGAVFAKVGAEGVFGVWIPADGLGIAVKCEDGQVRGAEAAVAAILRDLGYPLRFYQAAVRRWTGEVVGEYRVS